MLAGKRLVAGYEDGTVKVWDLKSGSALHSFSGEYSLDRNQWVTMVTLNLNTLAPVHNTGFGI